MALSRYDSIFLGEGIASFEFDVVYRMMTSQDIYCKLN